jgi:hypothetical protein
MELTGAEERICWETGRKDKRLKVVMGKKLTSSCRWLQHPFVNNKNVDKKPILDLLAEFKAEIINEVEEEIEDEVRRSIFFIRYGIQHAIVYFLFKTKKMLLKLLGTHIKTIPLYYMGSTGTVLCHTISCIQRPNLPKVIFLNCKQDQYVINVFGIFSPLLPSSFHRFPLNKSISSYFS